MMLQLNPPLPVITKKGKGYAHLVIDYGIEDHLYWCVFQNETGECWTVPNPEIRIQNNPTVGRVVSVAEPHAKTSQAQSPLPQPRHPPTLPPSVEAVFRNQSDTDPLRIRS